MTIPAGESATDQYVGNGVTTGFDYTFVITDKTDLKVAVTDLDGR